jgi:tetrapyrrole methylase family protein/MazG family protein
VAKTGFDWDSLNAVIEKLEEELAEFKSALKSLSQASKRSHHATMELGDILFTLVNVARFLSIHPEGALRDATRKFEGRFKHLEAMVVAEGKEIGALSPEEMQRYWEKAKGRAE